MVTTNDSATIKSIKQVIKTDLQKRYSTSALQKMLIVSTYLDPQYKELPFLDETEKQKMISDVENELFTMETTTLTELTHEDKEELQEQEEIEEPPEKQSKQGPVTKLLGDLFEVNVHTPLYSDRMSNEMELYRTEQTLQLQFTILNIIKWMARHC